jgi:hypothetical protein
MSTKNNILVQATKNIANYFSLLSVGAVLEIF